MINGLVGAIVSITPSPKKRSERMVPVAAEISNGTTAVAVKSNIKTSIAKTMEAMGALKIAAIAAEEPHANNIMVFLGDKLNNRAKLEPIAEPVNTIGASNPTE